MQGRRVVGWNVRKLRVAKGLSIEELAGRAGLGDSFVSKLERGEVNVSVDKLELLAKALRADLAEFFVKPKPGEKPPEPLRAGRRPTKF
jgi:transcriptional regulator with XRE-family HTH domain